MVCRLNEVKASFTVYLLFYSKTSKSSKRLVQHLSVNLEKACVTVFNMYHVTKNTGLDEIKDEYSISHASILLFWFLAQWEG